MLKEFALKHFFCITTLPCDCHDKFYDSFKLKKKDYEMLLSEVKLIYTVPQA